MAQLTMTTKEKNTSPKRQPPALPCKTLKPNFPSKSNANHESIYYDETHLDVQLRTKVGGVVIKIL